MTTLTQRLHLEPNDLLQGHTTPETAYVIADYPYGFHLRCQRRVWVECANKGQSKGLYRFGSQTTNPRVAGQLWNKPSYSTYFALVVLFRDVTDDNHIKPLMLYVSSNPTDFLALLMVRHILEPAIQERFDRLLTVARRTERWLPYQDELAMLQQAQIPTEDTRTTMEQAS